MFQTSTPDPDLVQLVAGVLRAVLAFLGGIGVAVGVHSDQWYLTVAGLIVTVGMAVWSAIQKYRAKQADHLGSMQSAATQMPVQATAKLI
jgi:hypothetical protein